MPRSCQPASRMGRLLLRRALGSILAGTLLVGLLAGCSGGNGNGNPSQGPSGSSSSGAPGTTEIGSWGGIMNPGGTPVSGGILKFDQGVTPAGVSSLDYLALPDNSVGQVVQQIFSQLVEYVPGKLDPQPGLAQSWDVSPDGLTYTFHLRDAKFSDGEPVTSADVKWVFDAAQGGVKLDAAGDKSFFAGQYAPIDKIETPDAKTVIMTFKEPYPAFIYFAAYLAVSIVPSKLVQREGVKAFNEHPIGSGPFVLDSWNKDQEAVLKRNPTYWGHKAYLDEVDFLAKPDDNTRVLDIQSGTVDAAERIPFSQVQTVDNGGRAHVLVVDGSDINAAWLNNSHKPFDEEVVRQALNYATPSDSIVKVVFAGLARRANTVLPKLKYWTDSVAPYPYDLQKAKALLAQSSVPNGFKTTISYAAQDQASTQTAQIIQQSWAKIGVDATLVPQDPGTDTFSTGEYDVQLFQPGIFTSDVPVDDEYAQLFFDFPSIHNLDTYYKTPPDLLALVRKALHETSESARVQDFKEIHKLSMADPLFVPISYTPNRIAVADNVHDFNLPLTAIFRLEYVWIS